MERTGVSEGDALVVAEELARSEFTGLSNGLDPFAAVRGGLFATEEFLRGELSDRDPLMEELGTHLLNGGGKRLRPALALLSGQAVGGRIEDIVPVAAACELIHMATLVHDDLVDESVRRRGVPTIHARWGIPVAVLLGDHLFARGFAVLARHGNPRIVRMMSEVVSQMCAGEIAELAAQWDTEATEDGYFERIFAKTGRFISECCRMGAAAAGASPATEEALATYGRGIGVCFQVVDDILDLTAEETTLGKPTGSDLRAGVYTLPVLRALQGRDGTAIRGWLRRKPLDDAALVAVRELVRHGDGLPYAGKKAMEMVRQAQAQLLELPPSRYRESLGHLAEELVHRLV